jgi:hypothetical protein
MTAIWHILTKKELKQLQRKTNFFFQAISTQALIIPLSIKNIDQNRRIYNRLCWIVRDCCVDSENSDGKNRKDLLWNCEVFDFMETLIRTQVEELRICFPH